MVRTPDLTAGARARAAARAGRFRATGDWGTEAVDLVRGAAGRDPHHVAVVGRERSLRYGDLDAAVDGGVAALGSQGVAAGDALLLLVGNDVTSVVAIHAGLRAGALVMVAPATAGSAQVRDIVAMTEPSLTLAPDALLPADGDDRGPTRWEPMATIGDAEPVMRAPPSPRDPDEPSMVIFTSGTTSRPKGVVHSLNTMLVATRNYVDAAALTVADNLFVISPLASVTGMLQAITVVPLLGAQLTLEHRFDDAATFDFLVETGATFFGGPDLLLDRVMNEASARGVTDLPLTTVYLGGSMLDPRILTPCRARVRDRRPPRLRVVRGAAQHLGDPRRTGGGPARPTTAGHCPASRCASGPDWTRPSVASAARISSSATWIGRTTPACSTTTGSARATSPSCATAGCASRAGSRTS